MQVEIKLDNLETLRVIRDGSLEALMKAIEDENKIDIPEVKPVEKKKVEKSKPKQEAAKEEETEIIEDKVEDKEYTLDEVRAMFAAKNKPAQRSKLKALLKKFNASNISGLDPKDYPAVIADLGEI